MKKTFTIAVALVWQVCLFAQASVKGKISFTVVNEQKTPVENATAELLNAKDSSLVRTAITGRNGTGDFENVAPGEYRLRFSSV